jgi:hypothetical protein
MFGRAGRGSARVRGARWSGRSTYKSLSGTVESVSVVATELGVDTLEGGVTVGLRLLDTVGEGELAKCSLFDIIGS